MSDRIPRRQSIWIGHLWRLIRHELPATQAQPQAQAQAEVNPYLCARRYWNEHVAAQRASRQSWQMLGILSLMIALASVGGMIYLGSQSRFIPYVVEVNNQGEAFSVKPAQQMSAIDARVIHASVARFVSDLRLVTPDVALQRRAIYQAYAMLSSKDPATIKTNDWLNGAEDSNPFHRAEKETVTVEITSVLPQTADTWQIDWVETVRDRQGPLRLAPYRMRALVTVYTVQPTSKTTEEQIRNNPLGIYVRDFSWSKQV